MTADTFTTAMFLITAVLAAGVLINAVFPVVYSMAGTFSSATHESDERLRTDFKIITTLAVYNEIDPGVATVWMKNIGTYRPPLAEIESSDVFCGAVGDFDRLTYDDVSPGDGNWYAEFTPGQYDLNSNGYWDTGETVKIVAKTSTIPTTGNLVYFQFILPNGVWRSTEFTVR